jgi:hypothetical protein
MKPTTPTLALESFATALEGHGYDVLRSAAGIFWIGTGGQPHCATTEYYTTASDIVRYHVDHHLLRVTPAIRKRLGLDRGRGYFEPRAPKFELTVLPSEVAAIAPWLARWFRNRDQGSDLPPSSAPVPMARWHWGYTFSDAADALHDTYIARRRSA